MVGRFERPAHKHTDTLSSQSANGSCAVTSGAGAAATVKVTLKAGSHCAGRKRDMHNQSVEYSFK